MDLRTRPGEIMVTQDHADLVRVSRIRDDLTVIFLFLELVSGGASTDELVIVAEARSAALRLLESLPAVTMAGSAMTAGARSS